MQSLDFAKCPFRSMYLARELRKQHYTAYVVYGTITPTTPRALWDERWQKSKSGIFMHAWVEVGKYYIDASLFQFGFDAVTMCTSDYAMYQRIGNIDIEDGSLDPPIDLEYTNEEVPTWYI